MLYIFILIIAKEYYTIVYYLIEQVNYVFVYLAYMLASICYTLNESNAQDLQSTIIFSAFLICLKIF